MRAAFAFACLDFHAVQVAHDNAAAFGCEMCRVLLNRILVGRISMRESQLAVCLVMNSVLSMVQVQLAAHSLALLFDPVDHIARSVTHHALRVACGYAPKSILVISDKVNVRPELFQEFETLE